MRRAISILVAATIVASVRSADRPIDGWPAYGHDAGGMRYSPLTDITRRNVTGLAVAWTFQTGDVSDGRGRPRSGFETTPIVVDGTLYLTTASNRIVALNPETGRQLWAYDPKVETRGDYGDGLISRGVATWLDPSARSGEPCRQRIFEATLDARLIAVDGATGQPCERFGRSGEVSLTGVARYRAGVYHMTSPPAVVDDVVVVGSGINDNGRVDAPSGAVRAFDARSGVLRWTWEPLPPNQDDGGANAPAATWKTGAANAWSILSVDPLRHLVFVPTGSASPDYYGGLRPGDDKWANSVVALRAVDGKLAWGFQLVHHDLWDYDTASAPLLATLTRNGRRTPVVVQGNKTGFLYVLNRETGAPVFPIAERAVPQSDVPGESASATQPFPTALPAVAPQRVTADDAWGPTAEDRAVCRALMSGLRNDGVFTPPSVNGTLVYPGNLGGMNWSGYAFDPARQLLIVNANNLPAKVRLIPRDRPDRTREEGEYASQAGSPYLMFRRFLQSPSHLPCSPPPWGTLTAVDLASGRLRWQVPLGSMRDFGGAHPDTPAGSLMLGGPIVTGGGLIFVAGTVDARLHAIDVETGKELWTGVLPAGGHATPMTYKISATGRQYVVIAAGGHAKVSEEAVGDTLVAFALPR
jgi:quinoprotein glucose dehydrogenase